MSDFAETWFSTKAFSRKELKLIESWMSTTGKVCSVEKVHGTWFGFHIRDAYRDIPIISMPNKTSCAEWMDHLGFDTVYDGE